MIIEQMYTSCLSEAAYYIESNGEAAIIDPLRDIDVYLERAAKSNAKIKYIFETHFHADFVSGHLDLAQKTKAPIVFGPEANPRYPIYKAKDGEVFTLGDITIEVLHTPGHTLESSCYLLKDTSGTPYAIFTGDTLFIGDVGRPDLLGGTSTKEELASLLFDSLNTKIKTLPQDVIIYPAHGAGSSCGKALSSDTFATLGDQLKHNYALQDISKEDFVNQVTDGLQEPPRHFPINAKINRLGYNSYYEVMEKAGSALNITTFKAEINKGAIVLDARTPAKFELGFIPGSINIGGNGRYAEWAGKLLPFDQKIIIVADDESGYEAASRLTRVGFEKIGGYLEGGFDKWIKSGENYDMLISVDTEELLLDLDHESNYEVIDVRNLNEFEAGHLESAVNIPLPEFENLIQGLDTDTTYYVHCKSGYRSVIASSIMKKYGFEHVKNVLGGFDALAQTKAKIVSPAEA